MNPTYILTMVFFGLMHSSEQVALKSGGDNVVEIYFVADYKAFQLYLREESSTAAAKASMEADIEYFLTEVNKRFKTLQFVNVVISKRKLDIITESKTKIFPSSIIQSDKLVGASDALSTFDVWVADKKSLNYDLALLWTGYDIFNLTTSTQGYAWMGTVCDKKKTTAVVEYDGTYTTVITTAHEIAHNLGASHDSQKNGHIMAPTSHPESTNRWSFSLCSSSDIMGTFKQITENCMTSTNPASNVPNGDITPKLANPESLCVRKEGPSSFFCRNKQFYGGSNPKGDAVCGAIYCSMGGNMCRAVISSDGMLCGPGKTCKEGSCLTDPNSNTADMDENCLYGDKQSISTTDGKTQTCTEFLNENGDHYCSHQSYFSACCKSCKERKSADIKCPYGDRNKQCKYSRPEYVCPLSSHVCCKTCKDYRGRGRFFRGRRQSSDLLLELSSRNQTVEIIEPEMKAKEEPIRTHEPLGEL